MSNQRRFSVVPVSATPTRRGGPQPDMSGQPIANWATVGYTTQHFLIVHPVAIGTPHSAGANSFSVVHVLPDGSGFESVTLTAPQLSDLTTFITAHYPAKLTSFQAASIVTRKDLVTWLVTQIFGEAWSDTQLLNGFDPH